LYARRVFLWFLIMQKPEARPYTKTEEIWSSSIHGLGVLFGVAALATLVALSAIYRDAWSVVGTAIFGSSIILLYLASTLYHAAVSPKAKAVLKKLDHIAIYYLIAGSYTPFLLVTIRGTFAWIAFGVIWFLAALGTVLKLCTQGGGTKLWSIGLYLGMGWLSVFLLGAMIKAMPLNALIFLMLGGLSYTFGVIFYVQKRKLYSHAIWHFFVLMGTVLHFFAVLYSCAI